jgi:N-acetyl sugar amidotransferase
MLENDNDHMCYGDVKLNQECSRCVMDSSVPDIYFDQSGICNYCNAALSRLNNEIFASDAKNHKLDAFIADIKLHGLGKPYDCIIGVSGGVDSSYVAYIVKRKFGLRPLAVHFDNGWNSELAVKNIEILLKELEIDLYTHVVDWDEFKDLQLSFLKASIANSEIPTDHAILALLYKAAKKNRVRYILHGGNLSTESIMPAIWMHDAKDLRLIKSVHKRLGKIPLKTFPSMGYLGLAWNVFVRKIRYIGILNYIEYNKEVAISILEKELGWRKYEAKHFESIYTRFFQGYLLPKKFGMDKRRPHFSSLIITGQMTREYALEELKKAPYDPAIASADLEYVCQKFGFNASEFDEIMKAQVKKSVDYPNNANILEFFTPLVGWVKKIASGRG